MNTEKNTALLIIDVQIGSFSKEKQLYKEDELLHNIQTLISKARIKNIPIFFTKHNGKAGTLNQKGTPGWEVHPSIPLYKEDVIIEKDFPDSFQQTDLQQQLAIKNIRRVIITGMQSEVCVDATCRRAYSQGYEVILAEDGHSTYDSNLLNASQIINHHNDIHTQWFATVQKTKDIYI